LKNTHLLRYAHPSSLQRTELYASFLRISRSLHLDVFDQPEEYCFFKKPANVRARKVSSFVYKIAAGIVKPFAASMILTSKILYPARGCVV